MSKKTKNTTGDFITMRGLNRNIVQSNDTASTYNQDPIISQMVKADKLINLNQKAKELDENGLHEQAEKIRKDNGLTKPKSTQKDNKTEEMLMTMWMNENDPDKKEQLQKMLMIEKMKNSNGNDSMNQMMFMTLMSPNQKKEEPKKSEIETLMQQAVLNQLTGQMGKDPIESLVKYQEMMSKLNTGQGELASFLDSLEKGKAMGLVGENAPSIEDRKLSLEEKRIDNEMELKKIENDRDAGSKADTVNALTSLASSFLAQKGSEKVQQEAPQPTETKQPTEEHIDTNCATCSNKLTFSHPEESRDITCPSCDEKYHWDSEKQEMQFNKKPDQSNSPL